MLELPIAYLPGKPEPPGRLQPEGDVRTSRLVGPTSRCALTFAARSPTKSAPRNHSPATGRGTSRIGSHPDPLKYSKHEGRGKSDQNPTVQCFQRPQKLPARCETNIGVTVTRHSVNCTEALNTAGTSQNLERAKAPDAILTESRTEARSERTERRTHSCGRRNEAA